MDFLDLAFSDAGHAGELGEVVCGKDAADGARLAVSAMNEAFQAAGFPFEFRGPVIAVNTDWDGFEHPSGLISYTSYCDAKAIGQRAQTLHAEIAAKYPAQKNAAGQVVGPAPPAPDPRLTPGPGLEDTIKTVAITAAVGFVVAEVLKSIIEEFRRKRR